MTWQSPADRARVGHEARQRLPPEAHTALKIGDRVGPVRVLRGQDTDRVPELMQARTWAGCLPFRFYGAAADVVAGGLERSPVSGLEVQGCGDAPLATFGMLASPERSLLWRNTSMVPVG